MKDMTDSRPKTVTLAWAGALLMCIFSLSETVAQELKSQDEAMAWSREHLELTGWAYLDHTRTVVRFISRPSSRPGSDHVFIKMRVERFAKEAGREEQSILSDVELNCETKRSRVLSSIGFANANLKAPIVFQRTQPDAWRDPTGTVMEIAYKVVCGAARPSVET